MRQGKHKKEVECGMGRGKGYHETSDDGKINRIPCGRCNGTGKVGG